MKFPISGPAYKHPAIEVNNQRCINMFPLAAGPEGRGGSSLIPTTGLELLENLGGSPTRNLRTVGGFTYVVTGNSVYKLSVNPVTRTSTSSLLGTLSTSTGTVYSASNPTQIIWVDGTASGRIFNFVTSTFSTISDGDFPAASQVKFIDGYFVVNSVSTGTFFTSALNNGLAWNAADVATAESNPDNIVGFGISKGEMWVFGEKTTEIWYNAANASGSPFSPRDGLEMQIGCGAPDSIVELDDLLIWLDNRGFIVQSSVSPFIRSNNSGYDLKIVSDEAITAEILSYSTRDDAIAMAYNDRGHLMYQITFPTEEKTWVFDYTQKNWHERAYYDDSSGDLQHHLGQFYAQSTTLHLMSGIRNGRIYISDPLVYEDNTVPINRIRVTSPFVDDSMFREVGIDSIEVKVGIGNSTLDNPHITMRYSHDGGHSWSDSLIRELGSTGEYSKRTIWNRLGTGHEWVFEFTIVENMPFAIVDGIIEIEGK